MSLNVVMERLKIEAVKEANALNPIRKGVYIPVKQDSVSVLMARLLESLIEGEDTYAFAFAKELSHREGKDNIYATLLDISFTHANLLLLNISNRATYLCASEQHRRPVKSDEVCLMYIINMLCKTVRTDDAVQVYKVASHSFDHDIKHARDTYWNKTTTELQTLAEDERLPIPQRIIALQYLYGVDVDECLESGYLKHFKPYRSVSSLWLDSSLHLTEKDVQLQVLLQLGYMNYRKPPMIGLALSLKKPIDNK